MRHLCLTGLILLACNVLAGCGGDDGSDAGSRDGAAPVDGSFSGPHAVLSWRVRCVSGRCPTPETPIRSIDAFDTQAGHIVNCDMSFNPERTERRFDITASLGTQYGIEVRGAKVGPMGGRLIGSLCQIRIFESADETVFAMCGSNLPTVDRQCQFQRVDIADVAGVPTVTAELRCESAGAELDPLRLRDVTAPMSETGYAELTLTGCVGL